ncbi:MAG: hypothetical protein IJ588_06565 [Prevotella sp.]|nr:hypothetical protein [Prevotella sp.]
MSTKEAKQLTERFLQAETTLEEERRLYDYYQGSAVAEELAPYQEFFRHLAAVDGIDKTAAPNQGRRVPLWLKTLRTVSTVAACLLVGLYVYLQYEPTGAAPAEAYRAPGSETPYAGYCQSGTLQEIYLCYKQHKENQTDTYKQLKMRSYESQW